MSLNDNHKTPTIKKLVVFIFVFSFLVGIIGGIIGTLLVASLPGNWQKVLGIKQLVGAISSVANTERITLEENSAVIDVAEKVSPAVVSVTFTKNIKVTDPFNEFFGLPSEQSYEQQGGGSGFIVTNDGLVLTNKHVVADESAEYTVVTQDGQNFAAQVMARDPVDDIAILKIDASGLPTVDIGDSGKLKVGQKVIAIGNALGEFQNTVTVGVISATERSLIAGDSTGGSQESLEGLLQTDAAINTGNSGGPLVNLAGQVVGINTATAAKGYAEGIGFAIPVNQAKSALDSYKKSGRIQRAFLGVNVVQLNSKIAKQLDLSVANGALISGSAKNGIAAVAKNSPAAKAGLKDGDIIVKVGGESIDENHSLVGLLRQYSPSDEVEIEFIRDGKTQKVKVELVERLE